MVLCLYFIFFILCVYFFMLFVLLFMFDIMCLCYAKHRQWCHLPASHNWNVVRLNNIAFSLTTLPEE